MGGLYDDYAKTLEHSPPSTFQDPPGNTKDWNGNSGQFYANNTHPPAVPRNGEGGSGDIRVNTAALKLFAENLLLLKDILTPLLAEIEGVKLRPGRFFDAGELIKKVVVGPKSISEVTHKYLQDVIQLLVAYSDGLLRLVVDYSTAEELNGVTAAELGEFVANAQSYLNVLVGPTGLPRDTSGTGGGSENPPAA
ncbi:hypothetical protein [Lentzea sp. CA-135723]|uniref:hypothetical protein n=1 Tax=Lentzea sp. CA-135723 TaxID=3239950 RepID=UPI003D94AA35